MIFDNVDVNDVDDYVVDDDVVVYTKDVDGVEVYILYADVVDDVAVYRY